MFAIRWTGSVPSLLALAFLCSRSTVGQAQTQYNPDVSLIGDIRAFAHDDARQTDADALNLDLHEAELALQGYLNPYVRADIFIAWHGDESAEIEELSARFLRGLPLGLTARAGQYLLEFGKVNPLHPHAYSFISRPLAHETFFGHEGLRDVGVSVSAALPTGEIATDVSFDVLKGEFLEAHHHEHEPATISGGVVDDATDETNERPNARGFATRWQSFIALTDLTSLSLGVTGVTGVPQEGERRWIGGADVKLRWKPDRYNSFTANAEWLVNRQPVEHHQSEAAKFEDVTSHGLFGCLDYQFRQRYNIGAVSNWVQSPTGNDVSGWQLGVFGGFAPVEETSLLRLLVSYGEPVGSEIGVWSAVLQLVFSLGPHQPHTF